MKVKGRDRRNRGLYTPLHLPMVGRLPAPSQQKTARLGDAHQTPLASTHRHEPLDMFHGLPKKYPTSSD